MKLLEKLIYATVLFIALYVVISMGLRMFEITSTANAHLIGGVVATVSGVLLFMFLLLRKK